MNRVVPDIGESIARCTARRDTRTLRHMLTSFEARAQHADALPWPALSESWAADVARVEAAIEQIERRSV
jgi:hypothetical protein